MTTELSKTPEAALAAELAAAHNRAKNLVEDAKQGIETAIDAIVECGVLLESAKSTLGGRYHEWLTEQAKMHPDEARQILSVYHDRERAVTKRMMQKAGILELTNEAPEHTARTPDPFAWCRLVPKVREGLNDEAISRMDSDQREVARKTLQPLVDLYERLGE